MCSWAIILGIAFVGVVLLSPLIMTMDRTEIKETIIESKGYGFDDIDGPPLSNPSLFLL